MRRFRFLTSGESHGKCLNAIIEGVPAGFRIKTGIINEELALRQTGYGRGARMKIEKDTVEIKSGVRFGKTTGAPICLEIKNKDYKLLIKDSKQKEINQQQQLNSLLQIKDQKKLMRIKINLKTLIVQFQLKKRRKPFQ